MLKECHGQIIPTDSEAGRAIAAAYKPVQKAHDRRGGIKSWFKRAGPHGHLNPEDLNRALQLLYAYWTILLDEQKARAKRRQDKRRKVGHVPVLERYNPEEIYLADVWLVQREALWQAQGRINRHGLVIQEPLVPLSFPRFRGAMPQVSLALAHALYDDFYPAPCPDGVSSFRLKAQVRKQPGASLVGGTDL